MGDFGPDKRDYYNADVAETEADALEEEKEARRIQQKQLESMTEADFGFDEAQWLDQEADAPGQKTVTEKLPEPKISEDTPAEERLKILKTRYPEFEPLTRDFVDLRPLHEDLRLAAEAAEAVVRHISSPSHKRKLGGGNMEKSVGVPLAVTKYRALSAYLGVIGMYLALLTSTSASEAELSMAPSELRDHPIVGSLVQCRQLWEMVKEIPVPDINELSIVDEPEADADLSTIAAPEQVSTKQKKSKKRRSRAERAAIAEAEAEEATRKARIAATEASLAELDNLVAPSRKTAKPVQGLVTRDDTSDFGDEAPLTAEEAAAKAQRKKSLRFYTSQIAQKANKRGTASRDAGGDADLPYKERLRDRQERLTRQAEKRGGAGVDLDDLSDNEPNGRTNLERERGANSEEDYYQTITSRTADKKATKSALASAHALASAQNGHLTNITPTIDTDGKRGISYEIAKNKGLTPHRKKDVRNPRVKKRVKYEEKMKKLGNSGQRKLYKGGEGRGGYGGETTGINRSVVRSTKL